MDKIILDAKESAGFFGKRSQSTTPSMNKLIKPENDIEEFLIKNTPSYVRPIIDTKSFAQE